MPHKLRFLIIEDFSADVELVERVIKTLNQPYEIVVVQDEAGLRRELEAFKPDIVLSDYMLPRFTGMEALKVVQEVAPDLPFIIVTGSMNELVAVECMKAGAWDYVIKERLGKLGPAISAAFQKHDLIVKNKAAQKALQESERRFRTLIETAPVAMAVYTGDKKLYYANDLTVQLLGAKDIEELKKHSVLDFVHPDFREFVNERVVRVAKGEIVEPAIEKFIRLDGKEIWVEVNSRQITIDGQEAILAIIADITQRKHAEERLHLQSAALEAAANAIVITDQQGSIQWANSAFTELTGYPVEDAIGENPRLLKSGKHDEAFYESLWQTILSGKVWHGEIINKRKDGRLYTEEMTITPVRSVEGEITHFIAIKQDITERKQAEEERERLLAQIHHQSQQMEQTLNTVPDGVLLLDADHRVVLANPVALGDLAVLADAAEGEVLTHLGDRPLSELLMPPPKGLWHEVKAQDRTFEVIARSIGNNASVQGWVIVIRDVTKVREVQRRLQQQERLAAVGELAAGIAHDFNNILAVIVLYAFMDRNTPGLPASTRQHLETIGQQAKRAGKLVEQILDFSRRAVIERRPMSLRSFLKEVVKLLERTLPENIQISITCGDDDFTVNADPTRMQQMLLNLAVNARDAQPFGGRLHIALDQIHIEDSKEAPLPEMEAGDWVRLVVADAGSGIPPEVLPHIFEPFFTTKEPGEGTGLGLAQVYGIVKQHGGHIDVSSRLGEGTTFTIYLPALVTPKAPPLLEPSTALPRGNGETILLVEDNTLAREALREGLESLGYRVLTAANGQEALEVYDQRASEIALVLTDLVMPLMGGEELFRALKERNPAIKIVVLTGHPKENEIERLRAAGLDGWLMKAFSLEQLAQAVARALT
ncbi:MAG: PAS domain S-box protein [Chloroflexi bacterium]|nr:PAS domain S-box protein [Chloroflexota bacterium]